MKFGHVMDFNAVFEALTRDETLGGQGYPPMRWQRRLYAEFIEGRIPSALDLPTGLGKTSVMAIWLIARTHGAPLPRRLVYVVDRRAVVDQATAEAERLRHNARAALGMGKLAISTLRGRFVDNREWLEDPAAPAIVVGTVDMIGSRLLFSGYGTSPRMRPYHAGLLGADTLVVLDEAHLVPPFQRLLQAIVGGDDAFGAKREADRHIVSPFQLLPLSATGLSSEQASFCLTPEDRDEPVVAKRLGQGRDRHSGGSGNAPCCEWKRRTSARQGGRREKPRRSD